MLVLFFGVSGVGKTTLMDVLVTNFGWKYVPSYMTRPLRGHEVGKISISSELFQDMEQNHKFLCVNSFFGNLYGTPIKELQEAIADHNSYWAMDFPITGRGLVLGRYAHIAIIVLPETIEQLEEQVQRSGRGNRLADILDDYHKNYLPYKINPVEEPLLFTIINYKNKIQEVVKEITTVVMRSGPCLS